MWMDAVLAYLHFTAIFLLFAFLTTQVVLIRQPLDARNVRLIGRMDLWYFGSAIAALVTGFLRAAFGAKGGDFYFGAWPIYAKIGLFLAIAAISIKPTMTFIRWRRTMEAEPGWQVPAAEHAAMRKLVFIEVHLAALIPVFAVIMARGLGH
jgi:putative membrane protein